MINTYDAKRLDYNQLERRKSRIIKLKRLSSVFHCRTVARAKNLFFS